MNSTISIKGLKKNEERGNWEFTLDETDVFGETRIRDFSTNNGGDGLFSASMMVQHTGTAQFTLSGCTKSAAYSRIRRHFA